MRKTVKRTLSLLLAIVLAMAVLPFSGSAQQLPDTTTDTQVATALQPAASAEVVALREENVKHFDMGNGTFQAIAYSHPVHELDENGQWQDIDFSLSLSQTRGVSTYENKAAGVSFPTTYTQGQPILSLSGAGNSIEMTFLAPAAAVKRGASATSAARVSNPTNTFRTIQEASEAAFSSTLVYEDVLPDVDFEYIVEPDGVKENIVVNTRKSSYSYAFRLSLDNLIPQIEAGGAVAIYDGISGELRYAIPNPVMYDADFNMSEAVRYQLSGSNGNYLLTVTADAEWINTEGRSFPVKIDPSIIQAPENIQDTYIDSDTPNEPRYLSPLLWVRSNRISYIKTPDFGLPNGATLQWANLHAYYYYLDNITQGSVTVGAYQVVNNWSAATQTWSNANNYPNLGLSTTLLSQGTAYVSAGATTGSPERLIFDITSAAQSWIQNGNNYGIALKYLSGPNLSVLFKSYEANGGSFKPRMVYQYFMPGITLELQYDGGYAQRYTNAAARITSQANILAQKYLEEFGLLVSLVTPVQMQSHADRCAYSSCNVLCTCEETQNCSNSPVDPHDETEQPYHHKNILKVSELVSAVPYSQYYQRTKIVYLGHEFCYRNELGEHISSLQNGGGYFGLFYTSMDKNYGCVFDRVSDENDTSHETMTLIHEFGHRFGARDHYNKNSGDTTASLNAEFADKGIEFSDNCIYGFNFTSDNVIENLLICEGCRYLICEGIKMIP